MNDLRKNILDKLVFNLECRASALKEGKQDTAYHFWCHAQEDLDLLDTLIQKESEER